MRSLAKTNATENVPYFEQSQNGQLLVSNRDAPYVTHTGTFWTCAPWSASCWWSRATDFANKEKRRLRKLTWKHWQNHWISHKNWKSMTLIDGGGSRWSTMKSLQNKIVPETNGEKIRSISGNAKSACAPNHRKRNASATVQHVRNQLHVRIVKIQ